MSGPISGGPWGNPSPNFDSVTIGGSPVAAADTAGQPIVTLTVGASPFAYTLPARGAVAVIGGTVTAVTLTRGGTDVNVGALSGYWSGMKGDVVTVTYTAAPTMDFVPL